MNLVRIEEYIKYFKDDKSKFYEYVQGNNSYGITYCKYDENLSSFISDISNSDLMSRNYLEKVENLDLNRSSIHETIKNANYESVTCILTYFIRRERFSEGIWKEACDDKIFLELLEKLKDIMQKKC